MSRHPAPGLAVRAALALTAAVGCADAPPAPAARLSLAATLGGADTAGYARALAPSPIALPRDLGAHLDYRTEWWYVTGHLSTPDGRPFGYQLTLFRSALAPRAPDRASAWATRQAYMGHLAVSDMRGGRFHARERFARGAAGLAGARHEPLRIWVEGWELAGADGPGAPFPLALRASDGDLELRLELEPGDGMRLNGDRGYSRKGPEPGNASYYFSFPRMPTSGTLAVAGDTFTVSGASWLDREWSTSALGPDQVGWDWFALQLDDGRDLMFYRLRRRDGSSSPFSNGVIVDVDGAVTRLSVDDVSLKPGRFWESDVTGNRYPVSWSLRIPSRSIELEIEPFIDNQELNLAVTYWEGAVRVSGSATGTGFVEMTGYGDSEP